MVRAGDFLEGFLGACAAAIHIGVVFLHKLAVLRFDFGCITRVLEVKGGERLFVAGIDGFDIGAERGWIAKHAAEGFLELGIEVGALLVNTPGRPMACCCIALEGVDVIFCHALEVIPFFVEFGDMLGAEPLKIAWGVAVARRAEIAGLQAPLAVAALAGIFHAL